MPLEYLVPNMVYLARGISRPIFRALSQVMLTGIENMPPRRGIFDCLPSHFIAALPSRLL